MRRLIRFVVVVASLVIISIVLWPYTPQERLVFCGLSVAALTYLRLKEPDSKGVSTILLLVAVAVTLLVGLYLTPVGITTAGHEFALWGITCALAL